MGQPHYDSGRGGLLPQPLHHLERGEAVYHLLDIQSSSLGMCSAHVYVLCVYVYVLCVCMCVCVCVCVCVQVLSQGMQRVLVLEDDIDFEPQFKESLATVMREADEFTPTWDLM